MRNPQIMEALLTSLVLQLLALVPLTSGHGRLLEPPSRASMWRQGYSTPPNYNDNQLFCGGVQVQYEINKGNCGVCGDRWDGPREHEAGGRYATGIIVRKYNVGQIIDVVVELTANHKGYIEFRLCPNNNPFDKVTHACLDQYPLVVENNNGQVRYPVESHEKKIKFRVRLPQNVRCRACFFQWKYNAGNSWGTDLAGNSCVGCGNQEQFYGCSDIAIGYDDIVLNIPQTPPATSSTPILTGSTGNLTNFNCAGHPRGWSLSHLAITLFVTSYICAWFYIN